MSRFAPLPLLLLLLLVATSACDAFWEGPTLPGGATYIAYTVVSERGPGSDSDTEIAAATSIAALRASIAQRTHQPCNAFGISSDSCWEQILDAPGHLYVAVTLPDYCGAVRETAALSGRTLYFIDWFGRPQGRCGDAYPRPHFRLLSFNRSDLPPSGSLTVDLQLQGGRTGDSRVEVTLS
jgi:hypothetical protein